MAKRLECNVPTSDLAEYVRHADQNLKIYASQMVAQTLETDSAIIVEWYEELMARKKLQLIGDLQVKLNSDPQSIDGNILE